LIEYILQNINIVIIILYLFAYGIMI